MRGVCADTPSLLDEVTFMAKNGGLSICVDFILVPFGAFDGSNLEYETCGRVCQGDPSVTILLTRWASVV